MLISWIVLSLVISLVLSLGAVVWDALAGAAYQNERTRLWVRKALLLEATDGLVDDAVKLAETLADLPSGLRDLWHRLLPRLLRAADLVGVALLLWYEVHHYYVERTLRPIDMVAWVVIVVGVVGYLAAAGTGTRRI